MISRFASGWFSPTNTCAEAFEQGVELHVGFFKSAFEHAPVEIVGIQHAYFTAKAAHVFDDFCRGALAQHQVVLIARAGFGHIYERLHAEGVMLRGNSRAHMARAVLGIAALEHVGLLDYLARIAPKAGRRWSAPRRDCCA